ncbi:hypothetical protein EV421DRAFT_1902298 [Armillaria borealis]|uniref:Uncharacterized protein n=1 Tax=Armillaria borealis TaxID=47425 RepID=A0AA39JPA6_9AGAR|nr:hypothetical protein EV421DRAFT_1902298 [Armillaria borealis]
MFADDIEDVSVNTDKKSHNKDRIITGSALLSSSDEAAIFIEVFGQKITHQHITIEGLKERYLSCDLPEGFAGMLSALDGCNASGGEEEIFKAAKQVTRKRTLRSIVEANREVFTAQIEGLS